MRVRAGSGQVRVPSRFRAGIVGIICLFVTFLCIFIRVMAWSGHG